MLNVDIMLGERPGIILKGWAIDQDLNLNNATSTDFSVTLLKMVEKAHGFAL